MKRQNGAALIVVLSLLTVSLMVGVSSIQSSQIDERLAGNYRAASHAQMNAEITASKYFFSDSSEFKDYNGGSWDSDVEVIFNEVETSADGEISDYVLIKKDGVDRVIARGYSPDRKAARFVEVFITAEGGGSGFPIGMISDGDIEAGNGQSTLIGRAHSNGELSIKLKDSSQAQLTDGVGSYKDSDGNVLRVVEKVPLPGEAPADADINPERVEYVNILPGLKSSATLVSCDVDISSIPSGSVVYCDGDTMQASGDRGGVIDTITIVSQGDIKFSGAYGKKGEPVGLAAIAGGDIVFNGSRDTYGVFWANGKIRQTGNSSMKGSIVAGGIIDPEGGINFESAEELSNPNLPGEEEPEVRWVDHG